MPGKVVDVPPLIELPLFKEWPFPTSQVCKDSCKGPMISLHKPSSISRKPLIRRMFARSSRALLVWCLILSALGFVVDQSQLQQAAGDAQQSRSVRKLAELRAQLTVGLLPASPAQEAFLDKVVAHVARGTLSLEMVQGTFVWACDQADWAYPYFEQALRQRARRVGVQL